MKHVFGFALLTALAASLKYGIVGAAFAFFGVVAVGGFGVALLPLCRQCGLTGRDDK